MKASMISTEGAKTKTIDLPIQFDEKYRPDVIKKAVIAIQCNKRQPYGSDPEAGKKQATEISKRRRDYKTCYGKGISRIPRKTMSRRGSQMIWVGAFAPGTVGGRRAHPPKSWKIWGHNINNKERRLAIRSAISATCIKSLVERRGHLFDSEVPIIIDSGIEKVSKTKELMAIFEKIGLSKEIVRISKKSIRAGKGKSRGRKYIRKVGPLIVVSEKCPVMKAASNLPGVEAIKVDMINAELLAPGCHAGRLTVWSEKAVERLTNEHLFLNVKKAKVEEEGKK